MKPYLGVVVFVLYAVKWKPEEAVHLAVTTAGEANAQLLMGEVQM